VPLCDEAHPPLGARLLHGCLQHCSCLLAVGDHGERRAQASHDGRLSSQPGDPAIKLIQDVGPSLDGIGERLDRQELSIVAGVRQAVDDGQNGISCRLVSPHPPTLLRCGLKGLPTDVDPSVVKHLLGNRYQRLDGTATGPVFHELPQRVKSMLVSDRQFQRLGFSEQLADEMMIASLKGKLGSGQQPRSALRRVNGQTGSALKRRRGDRSAPRATPCPRSGRFELVGHRIVETRRACSPVPHTTVGVSGESLGECCVGGMALRRTRALPHR
jgi:hypothetical protein